MPFDLASYRAGAETFCEELNREYYLHLAGHKRELEIEAIFERHPRLFVGDAVRWLREEADAARGDQRRAREYLLHFALDGFLGRATKAEAAELARLEASLEVTVGGVAMPFRAVASALANEPDADRRAELERERNAVLEARLNPLHREVLERCHSLVKELGWPSYSRAYAEVRGIDLVALAEQGHRFLAGTEGVYGELTGAELVEAGVPGLGRARRSDIPRFMRAAHLDAVYPESKLLPSLAGTLAGLGIDLSAQSSIRLDTERRETKSPRAFCSAPRVPDEVYLVVAPVGGADDFATLLHEAGHCEHYAWTDPALPFEFRHLGDNTVTESFAMLFDHLVEDPLWLRERLATDDPEPASRHARAVRLLFLRRYAAKLAYELELHAASPPLEEMPAVYLQTLEDATQVRSADKTWLSDVDEGFYVACYLRAWALASLWTAALRERFGERWFAAPEAGEWLRALWRHGQRLRGHELLAETLATELDFADLANGFRG